MRSPRARRENARRVTLAAAVVLLGLGCSTPAERIEQRRTIFDGYSESVQTNIRAGRVTPGMTEDAVWMALGRPDRKEVESTESGNVVVWIYTRSRPGLGVSIGGGSGGYNSTRIGAGMGMTKRAETENEAIVHFQDGVVTYVRQAADPAGG